MTSPPRKIAIIGGGLTGLVAALRLAQSGDKVTVLESGPELGGLASTFQLGGEPLEKAYHHLFRTDEDILALISELGVNDRLEWHESSVGIFRDGKIWPFMTPVDLLKFGPCSLIGRIRLGATALFIKHLKHWEGLVKTPALDWMRIRCGESATRAVWEPLLRGKFSSHAEKVSMAWLWARLHIRSNSREPGGGKERLGYIRGGFIELSKALEIRLRELGVQIHTDTSAVEIADGVNGPRITLQNGTTEDYDIALFTGSNRALERLLPETPVLRSFRERLKSIDYLGAICFVFESTQKLGEHYWINVNESGAPFIVMIRHTRLIPSSRYNGKEVYYIGAYVPQDGRRFNLDQATLESEWFSYLKKMFPDFDPARVESRHCFRFRDAQHVVTTDYAQHILPKETPVRNLFLANFTQIFPEDRGTNFAVREGEKVACSLIDSKKPGNER